MVRLYADARSADARPIRARDTSGEGSLATTSGRPQSDPVEQLPDDDVMAMAEGGAEAPRH